MRVMGAAARGSEHGLAKTAKPRAGPRTGRPERGREAERRPDRQKKQEGKCIEPDLLIVTNCIGPYFIFAFTSTGVASGRITFSLLLFSESLWAPLLYFSSFFRFRCSFDVRLLCL